MKASQELVLSFLKNIKILTDLLCLSQKNVKRSQKFLVSFFKVEISQGRFVFFSKGVRESQQHIVSLSENVKDSHGARVSRNKVKGSQTSLVSFSKNMKDSHGPLVSFSKECETISEVPCVFFKVKEF